MPKNDVSQFHGMVIKCNVCTNADGAPMGCQNCMARGYTAICLNCNGNGQVTVPVAGAASGDMKSTCNACGGRGRFGVNKPEGWVDPEPTKDEKKELATA